MNIKNIEDTASHSFHQCHHTQRDNCNDYFAVEGIDPVAASVDTAAAALSIRMKQVSLPRDNCRGVSVSFAFTKMGKQVFESTDRKFRWYALNEAAGVLLLILFGTGSLRGFFR